MNKFFFTYYTYISIIGFILLMARKDGQIIWQDLVKIGIRGNLVLTALNLVLLYLALPFTIPFSILNIIKK